MKFKMSRLRALKLSLLVLVLISLLAWASGITRLSSQTSNGSATFEPDGSFKGAVIVTLVERKTGPEQKLASRIDLNKGVISTSPSSQLIVPLNPGGRIDDCRHSEAIEIRSPNGEFVANCLVDDSDKNYAESVVRILRRDSNEQVRRWAAAKGWEICGLIWSQDSESVAILLEKERIDFGPIGLMAAVSGHPIPLETFELTLLSARSGHELRLPLIRKDSPSGWARVDWIE